MGTCREEAEVTASRVALLSCRDGAGSPRPGLLQLSWPSSCSGLRFLRFLRATAPPAPEAQPPGGFAAAVTLAEDPEGCRAGLLPASPPLLKYGGCGANSVWMGSNTNRSGHLSHRATQVSLEAFLAAGCVGTGGCVHVPFARAMHFLLWVMLQGATGLE